MRSIAEFLLSFESFREALKSLGWMPPAPQPQSGGGPTPPPPPPPR